ncbi:hypothetical protein L1987_64954 [Smallanthus sonchifolius]|uniref:Uncharacterized protein n=1 Tax=Smallanthus sonchifolius TaxID=185202 RepID=A0ACB9BT01_9ASTR|nr:hypothetical protein L1987_64954 [Smallanthus sonchifolius]
MEADKVTEDKEEPRLSEARREIVAALKFHRASMKQQAANNHGLQSPPQSSTSYWHMPPFVPPPPPQLSYDGNQNFIFPTQSLGLNLNYQSFSNLDTCIYQKPMSVDSPQSSSTPHNSSGDLHHAMDGEEMDEIRSLGEQHQIEWNDTINLVTSDQWCSFMNTMKVEAEEVDEFDQIMKFPPWLINANESQHFDDHFSVAYFQDPALPCMDIDEIEAMDGEWLA